MIELLQLKASMKLFFPFFFCHILLCFSTYSRAIDSLLPNQSLLDNSQSLVSVGGSFELGFFSPWPSNKRYVGIWFKNVTEQTAVWVANKNNPLPDSSGVLMITAAGNILILNNKSDIPVWSSNSSATSGNPVLQLLNSGNLVVKDGSSGNYLWQSFDHPCDTIIPGMKLGWNLETKENWYMTSWKSLQDPADEDYTYKVVPSGLPQLVLHKGSEIVFRSGPWDGVKFGGGAPLQQFGYVEPIFVDNSTFIYFSFINTVSTAVSRFVVNQSGLLQHLLWSQKRGEWVVSYALQVDQCDDYAKCGPNGFCNVNASPLCQCLPGFIPKVPQDWNQLDWTGGCVRRTPLNCTSDGGFLRLAGLKLPDGSELLVNGIAMTPMECKKACLRNCSCMAYTTTKVSDCVAWFGDLLDIRETSFGGQEIYIRMAAADIRSSEHKGRAVVIIPVAVSAVGLLISVIWCVIWKRNAWRTQDDMPSNPIQDGNPNAEDMDLYHLPLYDLVTIVFATNNFSHANKIGEGGFGAVYRGKLSTGQEIAVKRLSKDSGQGLKEFKNEVIFISRLQHRNLVRLLGCCIHGEERMLVYEYMPRRSLDLCLYNQTRGTSLDWSLRFNVIVGIARGLLYLHRDSRLRIIHRDLKVSNILLDDDMTPKISDFGLARTFGGDQNEENTKRVIGTYGYMSPEYAIDGLFSMKSDVFSFGVLVLEIISGKKNRGFLHPDHDLNLLGHAWRLWIEGRSTELVDIAMERPFPTSKLLKCIHVGLLCVQLRPEDRPTMASVVSMLDSEDPMLPEPKQPGFYTERFFNDTEPLSTSDQRRCYTQNEVTITLMQGR